MAYAGLLLHSKVHNVVPFVTHKGHVQGSIGKDQEGVSMEALDLDHTAVDHLLVC